jgi:hypothetical protein
MNERSRCNQDYRELISAYIDGDLEADDRQLLLAHLAGCDDCRRTLEAYRQIGNRLRALPPVAPPANLREAIFEETVESGARKLYAFTGRVGYSVAALAAVALIFVVAIYLLVNGYQRTIDPEVVASQPGNSVIWPLYRPIEITFNTEMDRESVEAALSISPPTEKERLSINWDGNTLILGQNQTLHADSTYTISITADAQDKWGKHLSSSFEIQFLTSDSFALQTPVPIPPTATATTVPSPTANAQETRPPSEPTSPAPPLAPASPTPDDDQPADPTASAAEIAEPTEAPPDDSVPPGEPGSETDPTATPDGADDPDPSATAPATATQAPTSTPAPTWTPRPLPTATAEPPATTPTEPAATATPDTVPVVGSFGNVYWGNEVVRSLLGEPVFPATSTSAIELDFQHGSMFSRTDTGQTYVFESRTGIWSVVPSSTDSTDSAEAPVEDAWIPGGSIGALWAAEDWIQNALGYAFAPSGQAFESRSQNFENGTMLMSSSGQIYVLYDAGGAWELYPDQGS